MSREDLFSRLEGLTALVNLTLKTILDEDGGFFGEVGAYSLLGGGKRLRPLIFCLASKAIGTELDDGALRQASGFELLHMATLMHDDIIDQSDTRRGRSAVHKVFGIPETVMAADYLVAKAGLMTFAKSNLETMRLMLELLRELSLGELLELKTMREVALPMATYMEIIYRKTAILLETVGRTAGVMAGADETIRGALADYGRLMGLGFQITDDVLDYQLGSEVLGKPVGQDLAEGRMTLPFILARDALTGADRERRLEFGACDPLTSEGWIEARALVEKGGGITLSLAEADRLAREAVEALNPLAASPEKDLLIDLAFYAVKRDR